ncbi:MAG TPA: hypothetical protein VFQ78_03350 [Candidatus Udaeobacter sp.]|nr:hypothetical protein [Candidatus Udaeobacter sp.]
MNGKRHPWLSAFFAFGTTMCALTIILLVFPGTPLDLLWRLNPDAHQAFRSFGVWSIILMLLVGISCGVAAVGVAKGRIWAVRMAILILCVNVIGDLVNTFRGDRRALIGVPISGAMILYLTRSKPNRRDKAAV